MGPPPVLSDGEEQVIVKWITVSKKDFLRGSWVSSYMLKNS